jgi:hypothetical protein
LLHGHTNGWTGGKQIDKVGCRDSFYHQSYLDVCPTGYKYVDGNTPKEKELNSTTEITKLECKRLCDVLPKCCSIEWSPNGECNLSPECEPTDSAHDGQFFCQKDAIDITWFIPNKNKTVLIHKGNASEVEHIITNSNTTTEVYCCNSGGAESNTEISFTSSYTVRTCGNGVSCENICVTSQASQNITVVASGENL